jgi:hypothetical protein
MAKKYTITCNQGTDWWTWTHETPISKAKIKNLFKQYADSDELELPANKDFTLDYIMDLWDCTIEPITKGVRYGR